MASSRGTWLYRAERFDVSLQLLFNRGKAAEIEQWLVQVSCTYNILPMDGAAFRCWAQLMHRQSDTLHEDAMIAAMARVHQLTVVTRNEADFSRFGVVLINPFTTRGREA